MSTPTLPLTRRQILLGSLATATVTAACGNGVGSNGGARIDARVDATLSEMYSRFPNTVDIAQRSSGMLVMPVITEAGLWLGGSYGQGALRVQGATVDYYSATELSAGLQIGAQQYAHVLFFMTDAALQDFRSSSGWTVGADMEYVIDDIGDGVAADTNTLRAPVLAAIFGRAGLRFGATLEGTKYSRIIP